MMENTKLFKLEKSRDLYKFGDTDFYLKYDEEAGQCKILDATYGAYNTVATYPKSALRAVVQVYFDSFYLGYKYGGLQGEYRGRIELQHDIQRALGL